MPKRIGILYGGGHISSFGAGTVGVLKSAGREYETLGFIGGYSGLENGDYIKLLPEAVKVGVAGTALGSPREKVDADKASKTMRDLGVDGLIVMGGNDHLSEALRLHENGIPVVGWPKTMDNDLSGTFFTLGYPTAVEVGSKILYNAHTGAVTNNKIYVYVLFGRNTDWVAAGVAKWGGADLVVPAERSYSWDDIIGKITRKGDENGKKYGKNFAVVAVAEGAKITGLKNHFMADEKDAHENVKISPLQLCQNMLDASPNELRKRLIAEPVTYVMRNSPPSKIDAIMAGDAGRECVKMIREGDFGSVPVFTRQSDNKIGMTRKTLKEVSVQRFLYPEGWIDYDDMNIKPSFGTYYEPLFGHPNTGGEILDEAFPLLKTLRDRMGQWNV